jgi:predicted O-methyltransferase YrrM
MKVEIPPTLAFCLDISEIPALAKPVDPGFFHKDTQKLLASLVENTDIVLELGTFVGTSTRFLADRVKHVYTIDHFQGSKDHDKDWLKETFPQGLYHAFVQNIPRDLREKITVYKDETIWGMHYFCKDGLRPDLIFIDASHEYEDVKSDLEVALEFFPASTIVMDDFLWENPNEEFLPTVQQAIVDVCRVRGIEFQQQGYACLIPPKPAAGK